MECNIDFITRTLLGRGRKNNDVEDLSCRKQRCFMFCIAFFLLFCLFIVVLKEQVINLIVFNSCVVFVVFVK